VRGEGEGGREGGREERKERDGVEGNPIFGFFSLFLSLSLSLSLDFSSVGDSMKFVS